MLDAPEHWIHVQTINSIESALPPRGQLAGHDNSGCLGPSAVQLDPACPLWCNTIRDSREGGEPAAVVVHRLDGDSHGLGRATFGQPAWRCRTSAIASLHQLDREDIGPGDGAIPLCSHGSSSGVRHVGFFRLDRGPLVNLDLQRISVSAIATRTLENFSSVFAGQYEHSIFILRQRFLHPRLAPEEDAGRVSHTSILPWEASELASRTPPYPRRRLPDLRSHDLCSRGRNQPPALVSVIRVCS